MTPKAHISSHVLTHKPKKYPLQENSYCGMYTIQAILSAYNRGDRKKIQDYSDSWIGRNWGWTMPWDFAKIFKQYDIHTKTKSMQGLPNSDKIEQLKSVIDDEKPVILLVGNGYDSHRLFSFLKALTSHHWISIWGYNDDEQIFYLYDSAIPANMQDKTIPIGNTKRSYNELLRDWRYALIPWPWRYLYMTIIS